MGIVDGIMVSRNNVDVSRLQFVDGTLIFCPTNKEYMLNYKRLLDCFALLLRLNIN